jgi:hypothetical protein
MAALTELAEARVRCAGWLSRALSGRATSCRALSADSTGPGLLQALVIDSHRRSGRAQSLRRVCCVICNDCKAVRCGNPSDSTRTCPVRTGRARHIYSVFQQPFSDTATARQISFAMVRIGELILPCAVLPNLAAAAAGPNRLAGLMPGVSAAVICHHVRG